ncbi:MAG: DUF5522 domain-containing protein [Bacteroidota bacterium]
MPKTKKTPSKKAPLLEGVDYYIENGLYVFTANYLQKRGYCCRNGCRHCPYPPSPDATAP